MTFTEFFNLSNIHLIFAIFIGIANAVLMVLISRKFFQILQISNYKIKGYNCWLKDTKAKYISRIAMLSFLSLFCVLVTNFLFDVYHSEKLFSYFGLIFYIYFSIAFIKMSFNAPQKTPLVQTRRMSRLTTLLFLLSFAITFLLIAFATIYTPFLRFGIIVLTPLLTPILVPLVHFVLVPLEKLIRLRYIKWAKKKLTKFPELIKIGITGSYGKTSVKYILNKMLSEKYNVCMSPHSFNTPMGLTKVVLKYLKPENQVLIAEMGAKQVGDIKELCDIINPQHAIITGIGAQHYETFGSVENIVKTKYELVESLPKNSNVVFNLDSEKSAELYNKCPLKNKFGVGLNNQTDIKVSNIELTPNGSVFDVSFNNKTVKFKTQLLGEHNILNIILATRLALELGVSLNEIANSLLDLEPVSHRLEPIENGNVIVLDDAYSSNEEGVKCAINVLSLYKNYTKICITPGMVEMGEKEFSANEKLGEELGNTCDYIIIVNKVNEDALKKGIEKTSIDAKNVYYVENLLEAKHKLSELLKSNGKFVVLFGNDLPDNYL